jgi:hypothetical protein
MKKKKMDSQKVKQKYVGHEEQNHIYKRNKSYTNMK